MPFMKAPRGGGNATIDGVSYTPDETGITEIQHVHVETMKSHGYQSMTTQEVNEHLANRAFSGDFDDDEDPIEATFEAMSRSDLLVYMENNDVRTPATSKTPVIRLACIKHAKAQVAEHEAASAPADVVAADAKAAKKSTANKRVALRK